MRHGQSRQLTSALELFWVTGALSLIVLFLALAPATMASDLANHYLPLHTTLEVAAIAVALMVFAIGWRARADRSPRPVPLIAAAFLGVAMLDLGHLLSYQGMPDFITPSSPEKAIHFWLAARLMAAATLLIAATLSWQPRPIPVFYRWGSLGLFLFITTGAFLLILFAPDRIPATFDPGTGLTRFKILTEYLVCALHLATALILWLRRRQLEPIDSLALILAVLIMALSSLFFTFYREVSDLYNLTGHLYKIIAYVYLYRALVISGIRLPYRQLKFAQSRLETVLEALPDSVFEVDAKGIVHHAQARMPDMLHPGEALIGHCIYDFVPESVAAAGQRLIQRLTAGEHKPIERYQLDTEGRSRWFELSGNTLSETETEERRYVLVVRDISEREQAHQALARSQRFIQTALDNLPIGVAVNSVDNAEVKFVYINDNFTRFYGIEREALEGGADFWELVYEDQADREAIQRQVVDGLASGKTEDMIWRNVPVRKQGQPTRFIDAQNIELPDDGLFLSLVNDVTERVEAERELRIAAVAFQSQEGIMITDADQNILRVNEAFTRTTGYTEEEVRGQKPSMLQSGLQSRQFYHKLWRTLAREGSWRGEIWNRRKNGEVYPQELNITAVRDEHGQLTHYVADLVDITALKEAEKRIERLAMFDPLTGLANRQSMMLELQRLLGNMRPESPRGGLLLINLDNFKAINDTLGMDAGDRMLIETAERLKHLLHNGHHLFRLSGDEYVIILHPLHHQAERAVSQLQHEAERVLSTLTGQFLIQDQPLFSSCSIGATLFDHQQADANELLTQATLALHQVKRDPESHFGFFDPRIQELVSSQVALETELRLGLERGQFTLHFQARVDDQGRVVGAEALIRWLHPKRGLIGPDQFIPTAERMGLIAAIDAWVLETAIAELASWTGKRASWTMSVNITAERFFRPEFEEELLASLQRHQVQPQRLMLEFTESMLLHNVEEARARIERLGEQGIRFAIDDFGTGYSSLAYLGQLPVHELKIDQSFVRNLSESAHHRAIIRMIIEIAQTLSMDMLAEGVETEAQRAFLVEHGCRLFQGYLFGRPATSDQLPAR